MGIDQMPNFKTWTYLSMKTPPPQYTKKLVTLQNITLEESKLFYE